MHMVNEKGGDFDCCTSSLGSDEYMDNSPSNGDYNPLVECGSGGGCCGGPSMMNCMPCPQPQCYSGGTCCPSQCCCDCNGGGSDCGSVCCCPMDNCCKVFKQVVHVGPPEPCHLVNRFRLPTPPPDILERTICVHPPQRIIHNVFQQPMKPPMLMKTNRMMGASPPDEIHNHCEMVQPRCRPCNVQCCCCCSAPSKMCCPSPMMCQPCGGSNCRCSPQCSSSWFNTNNCCCQGSCFGQSSAGKCCAAPFRCIPSC